MRIPKYAKFDYTIRAGDKITINLTGKWLGWEYVMPSAAIPYISISIDDGDPLPLSYLPVRTDFSMFTIFNNSQFDVKIRVIVLQEGIELYGQNVYSLVSQYEPLIYETTVPFTINTPWYGSYIGSVNLGTFNLGSKSELCISYYTDPYNLGTYKATMYVRDDKGHMWSMPGDDPTYITFGVRMCNKVMSVLTLWLEAISKVQWTGKVIIRMEAV